MATVGLMLILRLKLIESINVEKKIDEINGVNTRR